MTSLVLYSLATATLLALFAWSAEPLLRAYGMATRSVWLVALVAALALPALVWHSPGIVSIGEVGMARVVGAGIVARADAWLAPLWAMASCALLIGFGIDVLRLRRRRRAWCATRVGGVPVWLSESDGPAAGVLRGSIVLPRWVFYASPRARRTVLLHELEHLRTGDGALLAFGTLCVILVPWNPAVHWMVGRLHAAVELDCDRRVMARVRDARLYGGVLVEAGAHLVQRRPRLALLRERTLLERRVRALFRARMSGMRRFALALVAVCMLVGAASIPAPPSPRTRTVTVSPAGVIRLQELDGPGFGSYRIAPVDTAVVRAVGVSTMRRAR